MKKTFVTLAALAMASVALADTTWDVTAGAKEGTVTYSNTFNGNIDNIALGDAAFSKDGGSFTLEVKYTASSWANSYGTGLLSTGNPYDGQTGVNAFRIYVGTGSNQMLELDFNGWTYATKGTDGWYSPLKDVEYNIGSPITLGFKLEYVSAADAADGDDYFMFSALADSDIQFTAVKDNNIVGVGSYATLCNIGSSVNAPSDAVTSISITKIGELPVTPDTPAVPEPTTATLSLLALAGLAARRRRK